MDNSCSYFRTSAAINTTFYYRDIWMAYQMNTELFVNTKMYTEFSHAVAVAVTDCHI